MSRPPALVLVATPIGNLGDLSPRALAELRDADVIAAEDTRRTRKLLTAFDVAGGDRLLAVHEHNEARMAGRVVDEVRRGGRVVYVTDAGMPGISDPGARLVRSCVNAGLLVEVVPGPSAALAALVLSGFPTDRFVFEGFLPRKGKDRAARLEALSSEERTIVVFESPRRLASTLAELAHVVGAERPVAVGRELTKLHEEVWRGTLGACAAVLPFEPRGEIVIVLGPGSRSEPADDASVLEAVKREMAAGASARDAAAAVARELGVPKRRAYDAAVTTRKRASP